MVFALLVPVATSIGASVSIDNTLRRLPPLEQRSTIYAADGTTVLGLLGSEDRVDVPLSQVPKVLVDAVVDTEDATFWHNPGVDVAAMARSLVADVTHGAVEQGGSTITQQLVKNRLLNARRKLHRKLAEVSLALQLDRTMSKRAILQQYLNTVYFGQGAYGVRAAAERFFTHDDPATGTPLRGKQLSELTLGEAALLAGLIASPEGDNPFTHPDRARVRRDEVLHNMTVRGTITPAEAAAAAREPLPTNTPPPDLRPRNYFVDEVQQALLADPRLGADPADRRRLVLTGGLKVDTTLDPRMQYAALSAVAAVLPDQPPFTAALVAIDPTTGAVRALVGGPGYASSQYDLATHRPGRQAGSTYKVITLAAALEAGLSPNDVLDGTSPCTVSYPSLPDWTTENAEPGSGPLTLRQATVDSVNCAYAHLIADIGPTAVAQMANRLGVTQHVPAYLSITLGTKETTPIEMATVAATLAAGGVRHTPHFVTKVTTPDGRVLIDDTRPQGTRVLDPDVTACETDVLRGVVTDGTGTAAAVPGRDVAGKTGTTDLKTDAWFLGYTPQLATVVWMGDPAGTVPMRDVGGIEVFGGTYPARMWQAFTAAALADAPAIPFPAAGSVCDRAPALTPPPSAETPSPNPGPTTPPSSGPPAGPAAPGNGNGNGKGNGGGGRSVVTTTAAPPPTTAPPATTGAPQPAGSGP